MLRSTSARCGCCQKPRRKHRPTPSASKGQALRSGSSQKLRRSRPRTSQFIRPSSKSERATKLASHGNASTPIPTARGGIAVTPTSNLGSNGRDDRPNAPPRISQPSSTRPAVTSTPRSAEAAMRSGTGAAPKQCKSVARTRLAAPFGALSPQAEPSDNLKSPTIGSHASTPTPARNSQEHSALAGVAGHGATVGIDSSPLPIFAGPPHQRIITEPAIAISAAMSAHTASRGNGSGRPASSTIWNASVPLKPRTRGATGSIRLSKNTRAAPRTAAGRIKGQLRRRQAPGPERPAMRAASSHDGRRRSTAGRVMSVTKAIPAGSVVQTHITQSGTPDHDSRLTPLSASVRLTNGQGHGCGRAQRPTSPSTETPAKPRGLTRPTHARALGRGTAAVRPATPP